MRFDMKTAVWSFVLAIFVVAPITQAKDRKPRDMRLAASENFATLSCVDADAGWHDLRISSVDGRRTASFTKGIASSVMIDPGEHRIILANIKFALAVYSKFMVDIEAGKEYECVIVKVGDDGGFTNAIREKATQVKVADPYESVENCHPSNRRCTE
jgi:hypothetical protein